jgi:hypothetical protein
VLVVFGAVLVCALPVAVAGVPFGASVTSGATVMFVDGADVVTVVVFTVVVLDVTVGMVAVVLPSSPLEMIAAASPPSATTSTTAKAIAQPLTPDCDCGAAGAGA